MPEFEKKMNDNIPEVDTIYVLYTKYYSSFMIVEKITDKTVLFRRIESSIINRDHDIAGTNVTVEPAFPIKKLDETFRVYKKKFDEKKTVEEMKIKNSGGYAYIYDKKKENNQY